MFFKSLQPYESYKKKRDCITFINIGDIFSTGGIVNVQILVYIFVFIDIYVILNIYKNVKFIIIFIYIYPNGYCTLPKSF